MNGVADSPPLGELIRRARGIRRWTQQELADRLEVNRKTVDNWENGRTTPPRSTVAAIGHVLGVDLSTYGETYTDMYEPPDPLELEIHDLAVRLKLSAAEEKALIEKHRANLRRAEPGIAS